MRIIRAPLFWVALSLLSACSAAEDSPGNGSGGNGATGGSNAHPDASTTGSGGSGGSSSSGAGGNGGSAGSAGNQGSGGSAGNSGSAGSGGSSGSAGSAGAAGSGGSAGAAGSAGQGGSSGSSDGGTGVVDAAQEPAPVYMNAVSDPKKCWTDSEQHKGGLTFYDQTPLGNCGEPWPADGMFAAMSTADYGTSGMCGTCVEITGPSGIKATVHAVDQCPIATNPLCTKGHIDLSQKAFRTVMPGGEGQIPNSPGVSWRYVPCNVTGTITYHFKKDSGQFWLAVQARNGKYAVKNIEYRATDGTWKAMAQRTVDLAFFVLDKPPATTLDLRVTDINGQTVEDVGVKVASDVDVKSHAQFPTCTP